MKAESESPTQVELEQFVMVDGVDLGDVLVAATGAKFVVDARTLRVRDSDVSDKDRAEIQATMLGPKVLDSERFHEIRFHSTEVNRLGTDKWNLRGDLTLHGQTRPVEATVERHNNVYRGSTQLRQKDFGIKPVSVAGGSVKVKDEVRVEFEISGK